MLVVQRLVITWPFDKRRNSEEMLAGKKSDERPENEG